MSYESNAPVIVGAGVAQQRFDDPSQAIEASLLMRAAIANAAIDAGSSNLLHAADTILMPRGTWPYANPGTLVAPWNPELRSIIADVGVLQQTLLSRACAMVADGRARVVLVCGGETKFRSLRSQITGIEAIETTTSGSPNERLEPAHEILTPEEVGRGLHVPARQYAMIDTALRRAQGLSSAEHIGALAELWCAFSAVAATNTDAWSRVAIEPDALRADVTRADATSNAMLAWPYTKLHCSQWNVDQAAGLIVCSTSTAARLGVARDRWVFAHVGVESNHMVPLSRRAELHRSPAVAVVGDVVRRHCGVTPADIEHLDIYSCFPAAVRVQAAELELAKDRALTVTGGMTFAGGPLNNYTLQAMAKMVHVLRSEPSTRGLVTNVSGMLTKYGASVWSCKPPAQPFASIDVSASAAGVTTTTNVDAEYEGDARVLTYTVASDKGKPIQGIVIGESADGRRCLASTSDGDLMLDMANYDYCDRIVEVAGATLRG